ncbi:DNA-binding transcriptional LysR family regulator [Desulfitispora alkaliphila]|uniref:selenium metabolism-associated LysR family transcriptional regulator n=1 Tax=Desulfitispora alkaliphila TaxID=622674 RepID=UPI003D25D103
MQFQQLQCFVKVAELKSFSRAAEMLFLSQSTVSTHISGLEKSLGQKLFDRLGRQIVLTAFGEKAYCWAKEMLKLKEAALWDLQESGQKVGMLSIAASNVPAEYLLPNMLAEFTKDFPRVRFTVSQNDSEAVVAALAKGEVDIGLVGDRFEADKIEYIPIAQERILLITPPDVELEAPVSVEQLKKYPFLFRKSGSGTQAVVERFLSSAGVALGTLKIAGFFDSIQAIKQGVRSGLGFSLASAIAIEDYYQNKWINAYEVEEFSQDRVFYISYNRERTISPVATEFIERNSCPGDGSSDNLRSV